MRTVERILADKHEILGRVLFLDLFREKTELVSSQKEYNERRVIASRINIELSDDQLKNYFSSFGTVENFFLIPGNDCNLSIKTAQIVFKNLKVAKAVRSVKNHRIGRYKFYVKRLSSQERKNQNQMDSGYSQQQRTQFTDQGRNHEDSGSQYTQSRQQQFHQNRDTESRKVPTQQDRFLRKQDHPSGPGIQSRYLQGPKGGGREKGTRFGELVSSQHPKSINIRSAKTLSEKTRKITNNRQDQHPLDPGPEGNRNDIPYQWRINPKYDRRIPNETFQPGHLGPYKGGQRLEHSQQHSQNHSWDNNRPLSMRSKSPWSNNSNLMNPSSPLDRNIGPYHSSSLNKLNNPGTFETFEATPRHANTNNSRSLVPRFTNQQQASVFNQPGSLEIINQNSNTIPENGGQSLTLPRTYTTDPSPITHPRIQNTSLLDLLDVPYRPSQGASDSRQQRDSPEDPYIGHQTYPATSSNFIYSQQQPMMRLHRIYPISKQVKTVLEEMNQMDLHSSLRILVYSHHVQRNHKMSNIRINHPKLVSVVQSARKSTMGIKYVQKLSF